MGLQVQLQSQSSHVILIITIDTLQHQTRNVQGYFKPSRVSSKRIFVHVLFSRKPPQTIYQQKGYKINEIIIEIDEIMFGLRFCFPKAAEAANSKMTN